MKLLVETVGGFQLMEPSNGALIRHKGYTVVGITPFIEEQLTAQLRTVAQLSDEATDTEWLKYVAESAGDTDLAVEAFKSEFGLEGSEGIKQEKVSKSKKAKGALPPPLVPMDPQLDLGDQPEADA